MENRAFTPPMNHGTELGLNGVKTDGFAKQPDGKRRRNNVLNIAFRFLAFALSLGGFVMMVLSKETAVIAVPLGLVTYDIDATAEWQYDTTFQFFLIATGTACVYSFVTFMFAVVLRSKISYPAALAWTFFVFDLAIGYLLLSGCAALTSNAMIGKFGNKHTVWAPICDKFPNFCNKVGLAMIAGYFSFVNLANATILDAYHLYLTGGRI